MQINMSEKVFQCAWGGWGYVRNNISRKILNAGIFQRIFARNFTLDVL
jgi:hypothetical protein